MTKILVTGDLTVDYLQWNKNKRFNNQSSEKKEWEHYGYEMVKYYGGAGLLAKMVKEIEGIEVMGPITKPFDNDPNQLFQSMCLLEEFIPSINEANVLRGAMKELIDMAQNSSNKECSKIIDKLKEFDQEYGKKHLVKSFHGFKEPEKGVPIISHKWGKPDIVLIHDGGFYFRGDKKYWPNSSLNDEKPLYIHKMDRPLADEDLWNSIRKKDKLIVIIRANDLREKGLRISRSLSWERTAYDFLNEINNIQTKLNKSDISPEKKKDLEKIRQLSCCKNLIVRFGVDGAILYQNDGNDIKYTLFYDPEVIEGGLEQKYDGYYMKGLRSAFISGLVSVIKQNPDKYEDKLIDAIKEGISVSRNLLNIGFSSNKNNTELKYPFKQIFSNIDTTKIHKVEIQNEMSWKIIEEKLKGEDAIYDAAVEFVKKGENAILKAPVVKFGKLRTADRGEIESFHSIKNLITEYLKKKTKIPLSIAVFGPPGAGKSFGVTELAKTISDKIEKVEFNISQFESSQDLFSAFHIIQSTSLKGKIPLVFFDEFDCNLDGEKYGWLRYFLSPMNEGEFKQGDTIHPIGQCIFVFAGGTKSTFAEFDADKDKLKGSDFVSRLRGYVNIRGLNQFNDDTESENKKQKRLYKKGKWQKNTKKNSDPKNDYTYMIRRAVALRTILEKNAKNIFAERDGKKIANIDDSVLNALIRVPKYKHGIRSMEAIVEMSILSNNRKKFERSALPSSQQLKLHVDTEEFKKCLNDPKCKELD